MLVLTQPRMIEDIHRAYLEAGADIIETDTFNATPIGLAEFGLERSRRRDQPRRPPSSPAGPPTTSRRRNPDKPRFVAGSIGPTNKTLSLGIHVDDPGRRDVTFDEMVAAYYAADRTAWSRAASTCCCPRRRSTRWC